MPDGLQTILTQTSLAISPLRAIKTPGQAVALFRKLGYEIPPGAFGGALPALATQVGELLNAVQQLNTASGEAGVAAAVANLFGRLVATVNAIKQLHVEIQAGGGGALPDIGDLPRRLTDFLVLDYFDRLKPDVHEVLLVLGLIDHEPNPAPNQPTRLINWNRFGRLLSGPRQIFNDVYQWESGLNTEKLLTRLEGLMRSISSPGGIYPQVETTRVLLGSISPSLSELRFPIFQKGVTPETYSQFGVTLSPAEAQGGKKKEIGRAHV